ncbi:MAG: hypothetical protein Q7S98_03555 [Deltaproteobacteria bacterium]|nr:hypothetical protein [Deltaproteobacteria bacterium]
MQRLFLIGGLILVLLTGCGEVDLHHNLDEIDADEILVLLQKNGISAKKEKEVSGQDVSWKITVPGTTVAEARRLLVQNNFPRRRELGLSGVYKEKGLVPTPDEQKARFLLALKGEIINSLRKVPGVVDSDVVLNLPTENEFSLLETDKKKPTASVIVRTQPDDHGPAFTEEKIQRFVANAIPNMNPNDVTVIISRAPSPEAAMAAGWLGGPSKQGLTMPSEAVTEGGWASIAGLKMDSPSAARFKVYALMALSGLMILSLALIVNVVRVNRFKQKAQSAAVTAVPLTSGREGQGFLPGGSGGGQKVASNSRQAAKLG